jgi:hypothetical protein
VNPILPGLDPLPLPGPVWLFRVLLLVTFFLHLIAMNFLMGGGLVAAISAWRGRSNVPHHRRLADQIFRILPMTAAATITLGVAPLLFLQVLYGRFFYTSSILLAVPWIGVVVLLCLAYYGHYVMALSDTVRRERRLWIAWTASLLVVLIGFLYTNNMTLMQSPEKFHWMYVGDRTGVRLNLSEPTLIPRFLHFLVAALAVTGLGIAALGQRAHRNGDAAFGVWAARYGRNWFAGATVLQLVVGVWFLFSQPAGVRDVFLGGNVAYTAHLFGGVFLALVAVLLLATRPESPRILGASSFLLALTILAMILVRQWVRDLQIGSLAGLDQAAVRTQWTVLPIFLLLFVAVAVTVGWMIRRLVVEGRERAPM